MMKRLIELVTIGALAGLAGCATAPPQELVDARAAYAQATAGPASEVAPAELHKANESLRVAEQAFVDEPRAQRTRDLAYVAQRKAQLADALARKELDSRAKEQAQQELVQAQAQKQAQTKQELKQTQQKLSQIEQQRREQAMRDSAQIEQERSARAAAERQAADSDQKNKELMDTLAKMAEVKEEERGLVVTLSGSVLFATNQTILLPEAQVRLGQVAEALAQTGDRNIIVEGHTDSRGGDSYNMELSQRRADAVRNYLVSRGIPAERIRAQGFGKTRPVGSNQNADGRANNRRVEIVIEPRKSR